MHRYSWRLAATLSLVVGVAACRPDFQLKNFTSNEALYSASFHEFQRHKWDNAITGFEKLTTDLPPAIRCCPRSYWYLASAHEHLGEHLLAAQSFSRLVESFPEDSLADDARARGRALVSQALAEAAARSARTARPRSRQYNTLIGLYPSSPLIPTAQKEIADLENRFAIKDYDAGDVLLPPQGVRLGHPLLQGRARQVRERRPRRAIAAMRLVEAYKAINYRDDAADHCAQSARSAIPNDRRRGRRVPGRAASLPLEAGLVRADDAVGSKPPAR